MENTQFIWKYHNHFYKTLRVGDKLKHLLKPYFFFFLINKSRIWDWKQILLHRKPWSIVHIKPVSSELCGPWNFGKSRDRGEVPSCVKVQVNLGISLKFRCFQLFRKLRTKLHVSMITFSWLMEIIINGMVFCGHMHMTPQKERVLCI